MRPQFQKKLLYLVAAAVFLLILAYRLPSVNQPFGRDQGIFACIGQDMLKGGVPYRDLWDQKPPGVHFTYALLLRLAGDSQRAIQVTDLVVLALTACMVYCIVKEISGTRAGLISLLVYFFYSDPFFYGYGSGYWARSQAETFMTPLLVAGLWAFVRSLRSRAAWQIWLAGLFWGAAFVYKYTAILYPLCALIFLGLYMVSSMGRHSRQTIRRVFRTTGILGSGFLTAVVPVLVYFGLHAALKDLVAVTVRYNLEYTSAARAAKGGLAVLHRQLTRWTLRNPFLWLTGIVGGITAAVRMRKRPEAVLWLFWLAAAIGAIAANRRYFNYYFIQITPPLAMLSGYVLDLGIRAMNRSILRALIVPALAACLVLLALDVQKVRLNLAPDLEFALGKTAEQEYYRRFVTGDFSYLADKWLGEYLKARTRPQDRIFIFGFEPLVYFLADRRPASRYIYNDPITAPYVAEEVRRARLEEMLSELAESKALYLVVIEGDGNPVDPTDSFRFFVNSPSFRAFVEREYTPELRAGKFHIYRRNQG